MQAGNIDSPAPPSVRFYALPINAAFTRSAVNGTVPSSSCFMNRVGKRRADGCAGRFAGPNRFFGWTIEQLYVDLGHPGEPQDRIARPINTHDAGAIEHYLFHQHPADGLQDTALDLCAYAIGINDPPAIMRTDDSFDRDSGSQAGLSPYPASLPCGSVD
jgi:hypothetical protein